MPQTLPTEGSILHLKSRLKAFPQLYSFLTDVCSPLLMAGKSRTILLNRLPPAALILNLGSGTRRVSPRVINIDQMPFAEVDIVADIGRLPFRDQSVDGLVNEATLEHVAEYQRVLGEMRRVLKPGGYLYLVVPFLVGYHASPNDYYRWTREGLIAALRDFQVVDVGIRSGPTSALLWTMQEWLAMVFSCNIPIVYTFLWIVLQLVTFPLKWVDLLLSRYSMAHKIAATFYYFGIKG